MMRWAGHVAYMARQEVYKMFRKHERMKPLGMNRHRF
jgi:hypothetical protein